MEGDAVTPLLRLAGLIAFAILVIVLLVFWVQSCQGAGKKHSYESYMDDVRVTARQSDQIGNQLTAALTTPGTTAVQLQAKINGLAQRMQQVLATGQTLSPPGPLREEQQSLVESLDFRVRGLRGLADTFRKTAGSKNVDKGSTALANQGKRLTASDVVWADLFRSPAEATLQDEGVDGVQVPSSVFVPTLDLVTQRSLAAVWQRIQGASTGGTPGGLHGSGIAYVKALPSGQLLSTTTRTEIKVTTALGFEVGVTDTGDSQEVRIKVTLTIPKQPDSIVKTATIPVIDPGATQAVTFKIGALVPFGDQISIKVDVTPVKGETNTANNTAEYPVIFTL